MTKGDESVELGCCGKWSLADFQTAATRRQNLTGIQAVLRVEHLLDCPDHIQGLRAELTGHQLVLLHANAVFAGDGSAYIHAISEDRFSGRAGLLQIARFSWIEKDNGVHIA